MAVRGAVAEKHLENIVDSLKKRGKIDGYRCAAGDLDKDFYLQIKGKEISLECKNIEVIKITKKLEKIRYIKYLAQQGLIKPCSSASTLSKILAVSSAKDIKEISVAEIDAQIKQLPQDCRESGLMKYEYSACQIHVPQVGKIPDKEFVAQFNQNPLTIDFQRTRNSTDKDGDTKRNRFYKVGEIDIVGACLFSRTMEWKFLFAKAHNFIKHSKYNDRYINTLKLAPGVWTCDLLALLES